MLKPNCLTASVHHIDDFHLKRQILSGQRMIEIHGDLIVIHRHDHTGQFRLAFVRKGHNHTRLQRHFAIKQSTSHYLNVVRVMGPKGIGSLQHNRTFVAGLQTEQTLFKTWEQIAVAHGEGRRRTFPRGIHYRAIKQQDRKMQGDSFAGAYALFVSHGIHLLGWRIMSMIIITAPTVMPLSATLNAGKWLALQLSEGGQ